LKPVLKPGKLYSYSKKSIQLQKRMLSMKNKLTSLVFSAQKINRQHIQMVLMIVSLGMLILGIGAPVDGGGGR
jgi:hypothetical protein